MARGRPPLDPAAKHARRQETREKYREKYCLEILLIFNYSRLTVRNRDSLNAAARLRMQRLRAVIATSDEDTRQHSANQGCEAARRYRRKVRAQDDEEKISQRKARKQTSTQLPPRREVFLAPRTNPVTIRELACCRETQAAPYPIQQHSEFKMPEGHASDEDEDEDIDEDEHPSTRAPRELTLAEQREENRARRPPTCPKCFEVGCAGCTCLCEASDVWVEHGGHFFPTCKMCGGEECPGCKCVCPHSTVLKEHGGHARMKMPLFTSP
ncbi:hypothetical protein B0H16DRAFT_1466379 [Mycena metata]|uniref:Uncharacterized protein n=1 Tax=Mycena metata TaxID=1033252 RepID=A0AAD7MXY8_9AGAR|nr:hypothetical protein B0H16DRAFT_1466379 [Mycena metata]